MKLESKNTNWFNCSVKIYLLIARFGYYLLISSLFLFSLNSQSSEIIKRNNKKASSKETITKITSKLMHIKRKSGVIEFRENVVIEQDDVSLKADLVNAYYEENQGSNKTKQKEDQLRPIKMIEAKGNVKIFNQDFLASGEIGHYYPDKKIFVIEDNVLLNKGTSAAKGKKFVYDLNKKNGKLTGESNVLDSDPEDKRTIIIINDEEIKK